jgi:hypothetical protein
VNQSGPSPEEHLAYLRSLAVAGRDAPLSSGPYLVAGGVWFGLASLVHWAVAIGALELPPQAYAPIWIAAAIGFVASLFVLLRRDSHGVESGSNRAINAVWSAVGISIFVIWVSLWLASARLGDFTLMNAMPLYILAVYGAAWSVAGMLTRQRWIWATAYAAFGAAVVVALLIDSAHVMLAYAVALFACAVVPGLVLMRRAGSPVQVAAG